MSPPAGLGGVAAAKALNPDPKPEVPAFANGEGPAAATNPVAAGFSDSVVEGFFSKTDCAEAPREPKGDCADPAKEANFDEAKAELEVTWGVLESSALVA